MKKIIEIVDGMEFPSLDDLTNMSSDNIFTYINSTFCTACANMLKNKTAYVNYTHLKEGACHRTNSS